MTARAYIRDSYGNETMRVEFDKHSLEIEDVKIYDSASREWVAADIERLPPITLTKIEDQLQRMPE